MYVCIVLYTSRLAVDPVGSFTEIILVDYKCGGSVRDHHTYMYMYTVHIKQQMQTTYILHVVTQVPGGTATLVPGGG